jgi:hypothetical protein
MRVTLCPASRSKTAAWRPIMPPLLESSASEGGERKLRLTQVQLLVWRVYSLWFALSGGLVSAN